jgi:hypothetical protein
MTNQRPHRSVPKSRTLANPESYSQPHLRICFGVDDMNGLALEYDPTGDRTAIRPERMLFHVLLLLRGEAVARDMMVVLRHAQTFRVHDPKAPLGFGVPLIG